MRIHGRHYLTDDACEVTIEHGIIQSISPAAAVDADRWIAPGLIDIQVNGSHGHSFCAADLAVDDVMAVVHHLTAAGVTGFCPTITTSSPDVTAHNVRVIARACESGIARERILGIHLEGPFISPVDGPRGAHPRAHVRNPDWSELQALQDASGGRIGIVTLAPELPGAVELISQAARAGMVAAIGHHAATREQIVAAVAAGAVLATHLGNGSHSELPRLRNYIWEQLAHDGLAASIIADGHHLPPAVVKSFCRAKGTHRLILISDVMPAAGLPAGTYSFMGANVDVREDGFVGLSGTPYLAGSTLRLSEAVDNVMAMAGVSFAEAVGMASANPAHLLGLQRSRGLLQVGGRADLTIFRCVGGRWRLAETIAGGEVVYAARPD
jgi:N-acetylglucosamine-6-phosphate deacetylase